jgi:hypothetical protein
MSDEKENLGEALLRAAKTASDAAQGKPKPEQPKLSPEDARQQAYKHAKADTIPLNFARSLYRNYIFVKRTADTVDAIWNSKTFTVLSFGSNWLAKKYWKGCKYAFNKYAFNKDGVYDKKRAGAAVVGIVVTTLAIPSMAEFTWDTAWLVTTSRTEAIYLSNAQQIDHKENLWSISGCTELPCTDSNSVYLRVRSSLVHDFWSLVRNQSLFFPDYIAGAIPPVVNLCYVEIYGVRAKFLTRYFNLYPDLLAVESCSPVNESKINNGSAQDAWKKNLLKGPN